MRKGNFPDGADENARLEEEEHEQTYSQQPEQAPTCELQRGFFQSAVAQTHAQGDPSGIFDLLGQPVENLAPEGTEDVSERLPLAFRTYGRQAVETFTPG